LPVWVYATAKSDGRDIIRLNAGGADWALFDLSDGTVDSTSSAAVLTTIEDLGSGHYRCGARVTLGSTISLLLHNGTSTTYDGDGASGIILTRVETYQPRIASYTCRITGAVISQTTKIRQSVVEAGYVTTSASTFYANSTAPVLAGLAGSNTIATSGYSVATSSATTTNDSAGYLQLYWSAATVAVRRWNGSVLASQSQNKVAAGANVTIAGADTGVVYISVDGQDPAQVASATALAGVTTVATAWLTAGRVYETIAFDRVLTASERTRLHAFMAARAT
jgi:hypothetical protein